MLTITLCNGYKILAQKSRGRATVLTSSEVYNMLAKPWLCWEQWRLQHAWGACSVRTSCLGGIKQVANSQAFKASFTLFPPSIQSSRAVRWESLVSFVTCMMPDRNPFNCVWVNNVPVRTITKICLCNSWPHLFWFQTFEAPQSILQRTHTRLPAMTAGKCFNFLCWKRQEFLQ